MLKAIELKDENLDKILDMVGASWKDSVGRKKKYIPSQKMIIVVNMTGSKLNWWSTYTLSDFREYYHAYDHLRMQYTWTTVHKKEKSDA